MSQKVFLSIGNWYKRSKWEPALSNEVPFLRSWFFLIFCDFSFVEFFWVCSHYALFKLVICSEKDCWYRNDTVFFCQFWNLIYIYFQNFYLIFILLRRKFFHNWWEHLARSTSCRKKVNYDYALKFIKNLLKFCFWSDDFCHIVCLIKRIKADYLKWKIVFNESLNLS